MGELLRTVSGSRINYRASYAVDVASALAMGWLGARAADGWIIPALLAGAGFVAFSFAEYAIHRWLFHGSTGVMRAIHQAHHDGPADHVALPCISSAVVGACAWWLLSAAAGTLVASFVLCGFLTGYVVYDTMHWYLHHRIPRGRLGRRLRELHLRHHFQDDTRGFGISAPYWDRVFHTAPVSRREATGRRGRDG